jgi:hypothetical protein
VQNRNQLCDSSTDLGVNVDLNATIACQELAFYHVVEKSLVSDTVYNA